MAREITVREIAANKNYGKRNYGEQKLRQEKLQQVENKANKNYNEHKLWQEKQMPKTLHGRYHGLDGKLVRNQYSMQIKMTFIITFSEKA